MPPHLVEKKQNRKSQKQHKKVHLHHRHPRLSVRRAVSVLFQQSSSRSSNKFHSERKAKCLPLFALVWVCVCAFVTTNTATNGGREWSKWIVRSRAPRWRQGTRFRRWQDRVGRCKYMDTYVHTHVYYIYMKINYAATATAAGAAFAHPCPPPLEIFLLCLPSLCLYVIVCIRLCVCIDVVTNSHFLCLGSRTLKLLICCANVQTISQRRVDEHGVTECLFYVCVCVCRHQVTQQHLP